MIPRTPSRFHQLYRLVTVLIAAVVLAHAAWADGAASIATGRAALKSKNLVAANAAFQAAVVADPNDAQANVLFALTRLLVLETQPQAQSLLDKIGVSKAGRNVFQWKARGPEKITNAGLTSDNFEDYGVAVLFMEFSAAEANLAKVTNTTFLTTLSMAETGMPDVTIDYGDVLFLRALLRAGICALQLLDSQESNVKIADIALWLSSKAMSLQKLFEKYPTLLTPEPNSAGKLSSAALAFQQAVDLYLQSSAFIRARLAGTERLIMIDPDFAADEAKLRGEFLSVRNSFNGVRAFDNRTQVSAGVYLTSAASVRSLLPSTFTNNHPAAGVHAPDPAFAGVLPGLSLARADEFFAKLGTDLDRRFRFQMDPPPPTIRIISPKAGAKIPFVAQNQISITGTAFDKGGIARIELRPSDGPDLLAQLLPAPAGTKPGAVGWTGTVQVVPGINSIQARAIDSDGNSSAWASLAFQFVKLSTVTVSQTGQGTVSPGTGQYLVGMDQTFVAKPKAGQILRDWTLDDSSYDARGPKFTLHVEDRSQHTLVANFIPNPFPANAGTYNSLFETVTYDDDGNELTHTHDGVITFALTKTGGYSGKVTYHGVTYSFSGILDASGSASVKLKGPKKTKALNLYISLGYDSPSPYFQADLYSDDNSFLGSSYADIRRLPGAPRYNVSFAPDPDSQAMNVDVPSALTGAGFMSLVRDKNGAYRVAGTMPDGTKFSFIGSLLSSAYDYGDGTFEIATNMSFFVPLDTLGSMLVGTLSFNGASTLTEVPTDVTGSLSWQHPVKTPSFSTNFTAALAASGRAYTAPPAGQHLPGGSFEAANESGPYLSESFTVDARNRATVVGINAKHLKLTIMPTSGIFSGTFVDPTPALGTRKFSGLIMSQSSNTGAGAGFSLRLGGSDSVTITP